LRGVKRGAQLDDKNELIEEINKLKTEIKKLNRQLTLADDNIKKYQKITHARENFGAALSAEKSRQEMQLQLIMEYNPDIIILLDNEMNFMLATRSFLTAAEIPGPGFLRNKTFRQVFSEFADETWLDHMEEVLRKSIETGEPVSFDEKLYIASSGLERYYSINIIPYVHSGDATDGVLIICHDISRRKMMEETIKATSLELEIEKATLETMFNATRDLMFCKDLDFRFIKCNKRFEEHLGRREADIIGKDDTEAFGFDPEIVKGYQANDRRTINEKKLVTVEESIPGVDGSEAIFETFKTPILRDGVPYGIMIVSRDITRRKAMEEALKAASLDLEFETATLKAIFDSIPNMIFCKDVNLNYTR